MKEKVKEYCLKEFENATNKGYNASSALTRAYGALMFVLDCEWDEELADWWSNEMREKFYDLGV